MLDFDLLSCDGLASPVALAPGELGALTQPRSPTVGGQVSHIFLDFLCSS